MSEYALLSTSDNPYNPHTEFDEWYTWDTSHGYNTLPLLARVARTSDDLPDSVRERDIDDAMNEIVTENVSGMHILVMGSDPKETEAT